MEETKTTVPAVITPAMVQLKINAELPKLNITLPQLQERGLKLVKNRDNLPIIRDWLADIKKGRDLAEKIFQAGKKPHWDAGKAWDEGKKLVFGEFDRIESMGKPYYDTECVAINNETIAAAKKKAKDAGILKGIDDNLMLFSNKVVAATTKKALLVVESQINLEKSPSRAAKYGEFHAKAIERYDSVLLPIIKDQKVKLEEMEKLTGQIAEAEANNDPDKMDELIAKQDEVSNQVLQNHALVQEAALTQDFFPDIEATEILPGVKTKRTNYTMEIFDVDMALKKVPHLLEISINKEAAKVVLAELKEKGAFEGKDIVIKDGIKYIATRTMEAL